MKKYLFGIVLLAIIAFNIDISISENRSNTSLLQISAFASANAERNDADGYEWTEVGQCYICYPCTNCTCSVSAQCCLDQEPYCPYM